MLASSCNGATIQHQYSEWTRKTTTSTEPCTYSADRRGGCAGVFAAMSSSHSGATTPDDLHDAAWSVVRRTTRRQCSPAPSLSPRLQHVGKSVAVHSSSSHSVFIVAITATLHILVLLLPTRPRENY